MTKKLLFLYDLFHTNLNFQPLNPFKHIGALLPTLAPLRIVMVTIKKFRKNISSVTEDLLKFIKLVLNLYFK